MARPQLKNGFTRIANELIEKGLLRSNVSGVQFRMILLVIRLTYGFNRKSVDSSAGSFAMSLRTTTKYIKQVLDELELFNIVKVTWTSSDLFSVSLNKDYESWKKVYE